jgi:LytS/YehU family sensor histidine kinase
MGDGGEGIQSGFHRHLLSRFEAMTSWIRSIRHGVIFFCQAAMPDAG